jgi:hypothetical protein
VRALTRDGIDIVAADDGEIRLTCEFMPTISKGMRLFLIFPEVEHWLNKATAWQPCNLCRHPTGYARPPQGGTYVRHLRQSET